MRGHIMKVSDEDPASTIPCVKVLAKFTIGALKPDAGVEQVHPAGIWKWSDEKVVALEAHLIFGVDQDTFAVIDNWRR